MNDPAETTYHWEDLPEELQHYVVKAHATAAGVRAGKLEKIFEVGKPAIVIGVNDENMYCRIAAQSVDVMKVLTKNYL